MIAPSTEVEPGQNFDWLKKNPAGPRLGFDVVTRLGALYADLLRFSDWCSGREKSVEREQRCEIKLRVKSKENNARTKQSKYEYSRRSNQLS